MTNSYEPGLICKVLSWDEFLASVVGNIARCVVAAMIQDGTSNRDGRVASGTPLPLSPQNLKPLRSVALHTVTPFLLLISIIPRVFNVILSCKPTFAHLFRHDDLSSRIRIIAHVVVQAVARIEPR